MVVHRPGPPGFLGGIGLMSSIYSYGYANIVTDAPYG
jgi:hypothetical protein